MKRKNKSYTVIIVGDASFTTKEFIISNKFLKKSILAAFILFIIFGFVIFDYLTISIDREKLKRLSKENIEKQKTITQISKNLRDIESQLTTLTDFEKKIKVAMGLTAPYALKEVGYGGPVNDTAMSSQIDLTPAKKGLQANDFNILNNKITELKKDSTTMVNSLKFVDRLLYIQKIRWASFPMVWPTKGYLSSSFGRRTHPLTGEPDFHSAIDIATQLGNKVIATGNGVVIAAEYRQYLGNVVVIDHGFDYQTCYGHLASFNVKEGQRVTRGQVIGLIGSTGRSSAPHIHYEIRYMNNAINPMNCIIDQ